MNERMIENNDLFPQQEFIPAHAAKRVLVYMEQDHAGNLSFKPASLMYHEANEQSPTQKKEENLTKESLMSFLKWAGLSLPLVVAVIGSTVWINSTIDNKSRENRLELKADLIAMQQSNKSDIEQSRQDVLSQTYRLQDSIQRLSDRSDEKFEKISSQLIAIQQKGSN